MVKENLLSVQYFIHFYLFFVFVMMMMSRCEFSFTPLPSLSPHPSSLKKTVNFLLFSSLSFLLSLLNVSEVASQFNSGLEGTKGSSNQQID